MNNLNYLYFAILGFIFPSNIFGAILLAFMWDLLDECMEQGSYTLEFVQQHIQEYKNKQKIIESGSYVVSYYIGHYLRNKFPL